MKYPTKHNRLGFFQVAAGISSLVSAGVGAYTTIESLNLAQDQIKFNQKLAEQKAALEKELILTQQRIFEMQADGISARNEIDLEIAKAQAEAIKRQIARADELESMQLELDKIGIVTDYEYALMELKKANDLESIQIQSSQPTSQNFPSQPTGQNFPKLGLLIATVSAIIWFLSRKDK